MGRITAYIAGDARVWLCGATKYHPAEAVTAVCLDDRVAIDICGESRTYAYDYGCVVDSGVYVALGENRVYDNIWAKHLNALRVLICDTGNITALGDVERLFGIAGNVRRDVLNCSRPIG